MTDTKIYNCPRCGTPVRIRNTAREGVSTCRGCGVRYRRSRPKVRERAAAPHKTTRNPTPTSASAPARSSQPPKRRVARTSSPRRRRRRGFPMPIALAAVLLLLAITAAAHMAMARSGAATDAASTTTSITVQPETASEYAISAPVTEQQRPAAQEPETALARRRKRIEAARPQLPLLLASKTRAAEATAWLSPAEKRQQLSERVEAWVRGRLAYTCSACSGKRQVPCTLCERSSSCSACDNTQVVSCRHCASRADGLISGAIRQAQRDYGMAARPLTAAELSSVVVDPSPDDAGVMVVELRLRYRGQTTLNREQSLWRMEGGR